MNAPHDLDRRLTLVENETVHIYDLIDERTKQQAASLHEVRIVQAEHSVILAGHTQRLDHIDTTLAEHTQRLDHIDKSLAGHTQRLDHIDTTLAEHTQRFDHIDTTLDAILRRLPRPSA